MPMKMDLHDAMSELKMLEDILENELSGGDENIPTHLAWNLLMLVELAEARIEYYTETYGFEVEDWYEPHEAIHYVRLEERKKEAKEAAEEKAKKGPTVEDLQHKMWKMNEDLKSAKRKAEHYDRLVAHGAIDQEHTLEYIRDQATARTFRTMAEEAEEHAGHYDDFLSKKVDAMVREDLEEKGLMVEDDQPEEDRQEG